MILIFDDTGACSAKDSIGTDFLVAEESEEFSEAWDFFAEVGFDGFGGDISWGNAAAAGKEE